MKAQNPQESFVTAVLEHDQLSQAQKKPVARKKLNATQLATFWLLRVYLLFMIAVVLYQVWLSVR